MKKALAISICLIMFFGISTPIFAGETPYNYKVKQLYAKPDGRSKIVYDIPIEVKLLDVSEDANWYKVYLEFSLGLIRFNYSGWAYIPVGKLLAEREATKAAISE